MAEGRGGAGPNAESAWGIAEVACDEDEPFGCELLARFTLAGTGTKKDPAKAAALFRKACDAQEGSACASLAKLLLEGTGAKDEAGAAKVADAACAKTEDAESCEISGTLKVRRGNPTAYLEANDAYWTACRAGRPSACVAGAKFWLSGRSWARARLTTASTYARTGCDAGDAESCALFAGCVETGVPYPPKDPAKAKELYAKACAGGFEKACDDAKRLGRRRGGAGTEGRSREGDASTETSAPVASCANRAAVMPGFGSCSRRARRGNPMRAGRSASSRRRSATASRARCMRISRPAGWAIARAA